MFEFIYILSIGVHIGLSYESYDSSENTTLSEWVYHIAAALIPVVNTAVAGYYMYTRRNSH